MSEIFHEKLTPPYNARMATLKLDLPFRPCCLGQKTISYLGPKTCNNLPAEIKYEDTSTPLNTTLRNCFSMNYKKQNDNIFCCCQIKELTLGTPICSLYPQGGLMKIRPILICIMPSLPQFH